MPTQRRCIRSGSRYRSTCRSGCCGSGRNRLLRSSSLWVEQQGKYGQNGNCWSYEKEHFTCDFAGGTSPAKSRMVKEWSKKRSLLSLQQVSTLEGWRPWERWKTGSGDQCWQKQCIGTVAVVWHMPSSSPDLSQRHLYIQYQRETLCRESMLTLLVPCHGLEAESVTFRLCSAVLQSGLRRLRLLVKNWVCRYGVPDSVHSDQGKNFESWGGRWGLSFLTRLLMCKMRVGMGPTWLIRLQWEISNRVVDATR